MPNLFESDHGVRDCQHARHSNSPRKDVRWMEEGLNPFIARLTVSFTKNVGDVQMDDDEGIRNNGQGIQSGG